MWDEQEDGRHNDKNAQFIVPKLFMTRRVDTKDTPKFNSDIHTKDISL